MEGLVTVLLSASYISLFSLHRLIPRHHPWDLGYVEDLNGNGGTKMDMVWVLLSNTLIPKVRNKCHYHDDMVTQVKMYIDVFRLGRCSLG